MPLHVGRPNVGDRDRFYRRLDQIFSSGWLSNDGPMVREFEEAIASISRARNCVAVCNGTVALQLVAKALALREQVVVPSFTFVATAHAIRWQGITPTFADIEGCYHAIGPNSVKKVVGPQTSGVVAVRTWGLPIDDLALEDLAASADVSLIFDSAHSLACGWKDGPRRLFGNAEVLSFHATKFLNTFEGGAILTDDDALADRLRLMRNFGFAGFDRVELLGLNGKMSEPCAAMGLTNLEFLDEIVQRNIENHQAYSSAVASLPGISLLQPPVEYEWNHQYVVALVDSSCALDRDSLVQVLLAENVLARRYFFPGIHNMEPYRSEGADDPPALQATERACESVMILPTGTAVQPNDAAHIGQILERAIDRADDVLRVVREAQEITGAKPRAAVEPPR